VRISPVGRQVTKEYRQTRSEDGHDDHFMRLHDFKFGLSDSTHNSTIANVWYTKDAEGRRLSSIEVALPV
jgi:hypothetical protein